MNSLFSTIALGGIAVLEYLQMPWPIVFVIAAYCWYRLGRGVRRKLA